MYVQVDMFITDLYFNTTLISILIKRAVKTFTNVEAILSNLHAPGKYMTTEYYYIFFLHKQS